MNTLVLKMTDAGLLRASAFVLFDKHRPFRCGDEIVKAVRWTLYPDFKFYGANIESTEDGSSRIIEFFLELNPHLVDIGNRIACFLAILSNVGVDTIDCSALSKKVH